MAPGLLALLDVLLCSALLCRGMLRINQGLYWILIRVRSFIINSF